MPKTLTKLQEQIIAKVLTIGAVNYVWVNGGEVHTVNKLRERGLLRGDCYGSVQPRHLTEEVKSVFFADNPATFRISNFHGEGWLIFHDRRYICKVYKDDDAKLVIEALKTLQPVEQREAA
ncbi:hypothetical protein [Bradyrhizobium ottawaense]|uniref:Phage ABA sandwich domain-containing protein n=1 Tax=Bradyrhizobium ottawaense TaxID=931866 RepID=A0ABY0QHE9_9BRAD|nr:hypothetical protein [Bradyrhizobium ottawaense]SDK44748.1 hypothetical protein SAMN05444163_8133 [Bradyrhizobium ottawaense]